MVTQNSKESREYAKGIATLVNAAINSAKDGKLDLSDALRELMNIGVYQAGAEGFNKIDDESVLLNLNSLRSVTSEFDAIEADNPVEEELIENVFKGGYSLQALINRAIARRNASESLESNDSDVAPNPTNQVD